MTTDPFGQYHSPYLAMGNDPMNSVDPTGGAVDIWGCFVISSVNAATVAIAGTGASSLSNGLTGGIDPPKAGPGSPPVQTSNGMKPASSYDYSQEVIDGKFTDDWNYILNGGAGNPFSNPITRWSETLVRDWGQATTSDKIGLATSPFAFARLGKSINQLNKLLNTGKVPNTIKRFDTGKIKGEKDHVHFNDGNALNVDGTWKHGGRVLNKTESKFLQQNGWILPK